VLALVLVDWPNTDPDPASSNGITVPITLKRRFVIPSLPVFRGRTHFSAQAPSSSALTKRPAR
jgi:hypothetical protein